MRRAVLAAVGLLTLLVLLLVATDDAEERPRPAAPAREEGVVDTAAVPPVPPVLGGHGRAGGQESAAQAPPAEAAEAPAWPVPVLDAAGRPLAGARVRIRRPSFSPFQGGTVVEAEAVTDVRGVARIPRRGAKLSIPAPDGAASPDALRFQVEVLPPSDRLDLAPLEGATWPPEDEALRLPVGGVVAGAVTDPTGRGLEDVVVRVVRRPRAVARTDGRGGFALAQLPVGEHVLRLGVPGVPSADVRRWTATTGTSDLRLVVEAGASLHVHVDGWARDRDGARLRLARTDRSGDPPSRPLRLPWGDRPTLTVHGIEADATYTLHLEAGEAGRIGWAPRVPGAAATLHLPLRQAHAVEGRFELADGLRAHEVRVEARVAGMVLGGDVWRPSGGTWRWRVADLPYDEVLVVAWRGDREAPTARGVLHATGAGPNVLRVEPVR